MDVLLVPVKVRTDFGRNNSGVFGAETRMKGACDHGRGIRMHVNRSKGIGLHTSDKAQLQKERRERMAMEVALSEAYTQTLREVVAQHDQAKAAAVLAAGAGASSHHGGGHHRTGSGGSGSHHGAARIFGKR